MIEDKIKFNKSHYHILVKPAQNYYNKKLYDYQLEAINKLDEIEEQKKQGFSGLLVLPTGAGKTFTAVWWILRTYINKGYKVLWLAHRYELLNQAAETFINASSSEVLPDRDRYSIRIVSGVHGRSVSIDAKDDLIIASKDSVNVGFKYYKNNWIKNDTNKLLLVIDEAHHAVATTYRKIIDNLRGQVKGFSVLGLTATPMRTAEKERGYLKVVFQDDIIYKVDMRTLITRGILSQPIFKEVNTKIDMTKKFTENEIKRIIKYDFDKLPIQSLNSIAQNARRNRIIVNTYIKDRDKYKQTIVFALNVSNAIALNKLFNKSGIKSNYVVSGIQDGITRAALSPEHNARAIEAFRTEAIQVLINVNILTEGTDVPNVQSVFLARPTISPILITQMIGRGLRGINAGGTSEAYIVGFVDEWRNKISFISPEKLIENEDKYIPNTVAVSTKRVLNAVSIRLLEMFTQAMDYKINNGSLESKGIMEHIPVGCYSFDYKFKGKVKKCDILVYNDMKEIFIKFMNNLEGLISIEGRERDIQNLMSDGDMERVKTNPHFLMQDFIDLYDYYTATQSTPKFIPFVERSKYDVSTLAHYLYEAKLEEAEKVKYLKTYWNNNRQEYRAFWGSSNFNAFCIAIDYEIGRIHNRSRISDGSNSKSISASGNPKTTIVLPPKEKMDLQELRKYYPTYYEELREYVYSKYQDEEGYYISAHQDQYGNRFKSKYRVYFEIDHIKPMASGGESIKENLQLLSRIENRMKGSKN